MRALERKVKNRIRGLIYNKYYYWYFIRKQRDNKQYSEIIQYYKEPNNDAVPHFGISVFDGKIRSGGLADRLKGIVSTYAVCKSLNKDFRIHFVSPFPLTDFLVPNNYDWTIKQEDVSESAEDTDVIVLGTTQDSKYQYRKQKEYLTMALCGTEKQEHVYTNAGFAYDLNFRQLYAELFRPSVRLQRAIDNMLSKIGDKYISVSCRFLNLLGDFNEPYGYDHPLSIFEKKKLIDAIEKEIDKLHDEWKGYSILLNSDSSSFLKHMSDRDYIVINEGNITHIDNEKTEYSYEKYEKTFLDLYGIANAEHIYLIKDNRMFKSGFPYMASKIGNKKYEIIEVGQEK